MGSPPCMGPRDFMVDLQTDCSTGDEGVKKDFGTEVSSKSFCRAASPGHEQDVKPHMDSTDLTTEDTAQCTDAEGISMAIDVMDGAEDWQCVPNRKGRKKP